MDTKSDTRRQWRKRTRRNREIISCTALTILTVTVAVSAAVIAPAEDSLVEAEATYTPYYTTEEYQEMKRKEQEEAEAEAKEFKASIEAYQAEQERKAEEDFKAMQEELHETVDVGAEEEPYPFNTMSQDWGADDIEGFVFYEIPDEYSSEGGYFPEVMQVYLWCICRDMGMDYEVAVAMIEQESGYQYDEVGKASDSGYFQVIPKYHKERMTRLEATDMLNPYQNAMVAIDYMVELLDKYDGNMKKALTAYNSGPDGAYKYYFSAGVYASPYAKSVLDRAERIRKEMQDATED